MTITVDQLARKLQGEVLGDREREISDAKGLPLLDLTDLRATSDDAQPWANPVTTADGWTIVPDKDRFVWHAKRGRVAWRSASSLGREMFAA